jgi:CBS domain-containing protein
MSRNIFTIDPEESIAKAARIMGQNHIGSLIVMSYKTPVGIVTERDLLSKVLVLGKDLKKVKVADVMSYPLMTLCSTVEIKETAKMMMEKKSRLAVFDCGTLVGIITSSDLIKSLPEAPETEAIVDDFMTKKVETLDEKKSIAAAIEVMGKKRIGSVIVTTKGEPIGIFTERDLLSTFLASGKPLTADLIKGTKSPLITATSGISVHEAAVIMTMKHIRRLPITKKAKLAGIITARDLVEAYAK